MESASKPHEVVGESEDTHLEIDPYGLNIYGLVDQEDFGWSSTIRIIRHSFLLVFFKFEACLTILTVNSVHMWSMVCAYTRQFTRRSLGINLLVQLKQ